MPEIKNVDDYLATLAPDVKAALTELRKTIKAAAPEAEETLSYQLPMYKLNGALVSFAAGKKDCSFYVISTGVMDEFKDKLAGIKTAGTSVHFTPDQPLPASLVTALVKARVTENQARKK